MPFILCQILFPVIYRCSNSKKKDLEKNTSLAYNTSFPALTLLEGLEGCLNKSKGWKVAFGMHSIRVLIFFFMPVPIINHYGGS